MNKQCEHCGNDIPTEQFVDGEGLCEVCEYERSVEKDFLGEN